MRPPHAPENTCRISPFDLKPGVYETIPIEEDIGVPIIELKLVPTTSVYLVGWIGYCDELGSFRTTYFCRKLDRPTERFAKISDDEYEHAD